MRVPCNLHRRMPTNAKPRPSATAVPSDVASVATLKCEEDENFTFITIDDLDDSNSTISESATVTSPQATNLKISGSDVAASILEGFFFGCHGAQISESTKPVAVTPASPTSIMLAPVCSCPHLSGFSTTTLTTFPSKHYSKCHSLPASPGQPKRPSLVKSRIGSNSDLSISKRNVSFTEISVREYDVELSDHPSCSYGPPIQLGWDYQEAQTTSVEDYEVTRSPHRREVHELVLSYNTRRRRLKQYGYKKKEIKRAEAEVDRIKRERMITELLLPASAIDETVEKVWETVKGLFRPKPQQGACQIHSPELYTY